MTSAASRREILKTAAWSVPLVVASAAVPHAVASSGGVFASFHISDVGDGLRTVSLLVVNSTEHPSGAPVSVWVNAPGSSQLTGSPDAPGWTVTASWGSVFTFDRTDPLSASSSLLIEFSLLVDSEDDLLLIGELRTGSLRQSFSLSR